MMIGQRRLKPVFNHPHRRNLIFTVGDDRLAQNTSIGDNVSIELRTHRLTTPMALFRSRQKPNRRMSTLPTKCDEEDALGHRASVSPRPDGGARTSNVGMSAGGASSLRVHAYKQFITLNISGSRYCVPTDLASQRTGGGMLTRFIACTHDDRLALCSAFFEHTQEYFFAR
jgi:hypothetical protein